MNILGSPFSDCKIKVFFWISQLNPKAITVVFRGLFDIVLLQLEVIFSVQLYVY